jgi:N6-adenosine-specific RNA methylase IME4
MRPSMTGSGNGPGGVARMPEKYCTIVADPPWHYDCVPASLPSGRDKNVVPGGLRNEPLRYGTMTIDEIAALPVPELAAPDSRLFLWATNRYLPDAFALLSSWGFAYRQTLVWHKADGGPFMASVAPNTAEYLLVAVRGTPERIGRISSAVLKIPASRQHSVKPDAFLDLIEQVSPGPYVELFARRARFGWDYWGNESLGTAQMEDVA